MIGRIVKASAYLGALGIGGFALSYFLILPLLGQPGSPRDFTGITGNAAQGKYLVSAAGCVACHTDFKNKAKLFARGPALKTPFGIFYAPNITSDPKFGIGDWSMASFAKALTSGVSPTGNHYFPAFPYTSYTGMKNQDIADIKAYLDSVPAVSEPSRPHEVSWPFSDRRFVGGWKFSFFNDGVYRPLAKKTRKWNRGAYLANVLGHCGECHTQRNLLGGYSGIPFAGNTRGPGGSKVPGLRSLKSGKQSWSRDDITMALQLGMKPSGDFMGDVMAEVIEHSTAKLTPDDLDALAVYLVSLKK